MSLFKYGGRDEPWTEEDIVEVMDSAKQIIQRATDEISGTDVSEMELSNILNDGRIIDTTDNGSLVVMYRGEKFTVTIDHPEL
jgi:hypothetical protein